MAEEIQSKAPENQEGQKVDTRQENLNAQKDAVRNAANQMNLITDDALPLSDGKEVKGQNITDALKQKLGPLFNKEYGMPKDEKGRSAGPADFTKDCNFIFGRTENGRNAAFRLNYKDRNGDWVNTSIVSLGDLTRNENGELIFIEFTDPFDGLTDAEKTEIMGVFTPPLQEKAKIIAKNP